MGIGRNKAPTGAVGRSRAHCRRSLHRFLQQAGTRHVRGAQVKSGERWSARGGASALSWSGRQDARSKEQRNADGGRLQMPDRQGCRDAVRLPVAVGAMVGERKGSLRGGDHPADAVIGPRRVGCVGRLTGKRFMRMRQRSECVEQHIEQRHQRGRETKRSAIARELVQRDAPIQKMQNEASDPYPFMIPHIEMAKFPISEVRRPCSAPPPGSAGIPGLHTWRAYPASCGAPTPGSAAPVHPRAAHSRGPAFAHGTAPSDRA